MTKDQVVETLKNFFVNELGIETSVGPDQELFSSSLLDSMNLLKVVTFIESEFKLSVSPFDVSLESFDTMGTIADFVISKA